MASRSLPHNAPHFRKVQKPTSKTFAPVPHRNCLTLNSGHFIGSFGLSAKCQKCLMQRGKQTLWVATSQLRENARDVTHAPMFGTLTVFHPKNIAGSKAKRAISRSDPE